MVNVLGGRGITNAVEATSAGLSHRRMEGDFRTLLIMSVVSKRSQKNA